MLATVDGATFDSSDDAPFVHFGRRISVSRSANDRFTCTKPDKIFPIGHSPGCSQCDSSHCLYPRRQWIFQETWYNAVGHRPLPCTQLAKSCARLPSSDSCTRWTLDHTNLLHCMRSASARRCLAASSPTNVKSIFPVGACSTLLQIQLQSLSS